jgi:hypothetical protein
MYFDAAPRRRAPSVNTADATAPQKNRRTRNPPDRHASSSRTSASRWPRCVTLPVAWATTTAHRMNRMTFV